VGWAALGPRGAGGRRATRPPARRSHLLTSGPKQPSGRWRRQGRGFGRGAGAGCGTGVWGSRGRAHRRTLPGVLRRWRPGTRGPRAAAGGEWGALAWRGCGRVASLALPTCAVAGTTLEEWHIWAPVPPCRVTLAKMHLHPGPQFPHLYSGGWWDPGTLQLLWSGRTR
jgi:hypothetical protein